MIIPDKPPMKRPDYKISGQGGTQIEESAWGLFRRLRTKFGFQNRLCYHLCGHLKCDTTEHPIDCLCSDTDEQEAIAIMQQIERELNGE